MARPAHRRSWIVLTLALLTFALFPNAITSTAHAAAADCVGSPGTELEFAL